jgi:hypothetical protein
MATSQRIPLPEPTTTTDGVLAALTRLARLELELALTEARAFVVSVAVAVAIAVVGAVALIAAAIVLLAAVPAPFFGARWEPFVIAGGGVVVVAAVAVGWSAWRLAHLEIPRHAIVSFEENWRWLGAQLKSKLTLR